MASAEFHHFGVPTTQKHEGESYLEGGKVHLTDPEKHPFRVEFLRFDADTPLPSELRNQTHAAFIVPSVEEAIKGFNVLLPPFDATDVFRCAFIKDGEALIEIMERR